GVNNVAIVIPAGVGHAIRSASSGDLTMVYGTSTIFDPDNEGRIASGIEKAPLPDDWEQYLG
ncbi:MAG: dTDP-4-dehydrorhamnose 3,5-epimerase-like enzyme, partial [Verrucomicrobiales bacterium]